MKTIFALSILFLTITAHSELTPWEKKFNDYAQGLPKDVVKLLHRMDECNHFAGEPGYDQERIKQIEQALKKLKCNRLEKDKNAAIKKYRKKPEIVKKINEFPELK